MHLAPLIDQQGIGVVLEADQPTLAAQQLERYLLDTFGLGRRRPERENGRKPLFIRGL